MGQVADNREYRDAEAIGQHQHGKPACGRRQSGAKYEKQKGRGVADGQGAAETAEFIADKEAECRMPPATTKTGNTAGNGGAIGSSRNHRENGDDGIDVLTCRI
jgi:hypothetical protein